MINISYVSLGQWFDFENNTDVRGELNIFCLYISKYFSYFRVKFISNLEL